MVLRNPNPAPNPNPTRISGALWRLWTDFDYAIPSALLGGIYAAKPGYHNHRSALPSSDYSVEDVAADREGSSLLAAAIDLTLPAAQMKAVTARLDRAARVRDPRLYSARGPVLREFIGTLNGEDVYCYVLTGGRALGVNTDAGPDPGRDPSHLWHVHLSIIRKFAADWLALSGVLSVLVGEPLEEWEGSGMSDLDSQRIWATTQRVEALAKGTESITTVWSENNPTGKETQWAIQVLKSIAAGVAAIGSAIPGVDEAVAAQLAPHLAALQEAVSLTPAQVVSLLAAQPAKDAALLVLASTGRVRTAELRDALTEVLRLDNPVVPGPTE